jgi:[ribosomal protein S5]-alanine N-acetyltransferase
MDSGDRFYIDTYRLRIQKPTIHDFSERYKMMCDPEVRKFTGGILKLSSEEAEEKYLESIDKFGKNNNYIFSVIDKVSNSYIGYCGFQYCEIITDIEILYGFKRSVWKCGYAKESASAILNYGFLSLGFEVISAAVNSINIASEKILCYIGLKYSNDIEWPNQGKVKLYSLTKKEYLEDRQSD